MIFIRSNRIKLICNQGNMFRERNGLFPGMPNIFSILKNFPGVSKMFSGIPEKGAVSGLFDTVAPMFSRRYFQYAFLPVISAFLAFTEAQAQQKDFKYKFIAKVMNADSAAVIPNCHIINKTQNLGTVTDEYGTFTITANKGDSIELSSIGFAGIVFAVHDSMYTNNRMIRMTPVAYELSEVNVGILSTYDRFKRDIMGKESGAGYKIDPLVSKWSVAVKPLPGQGGINMPGLGSPVTFLYNLWSREGKQQRRYLSIINGTAEHIVLGNKFNGFIVHQLTGLEDDELVDFMSFCMFTKDYLMIAPEAEINREIMRKYKIYLENNGRWRLTE